MNCCVTKGSFFVSHYEIHIPSFFSLLTTSTNTIITTFNNEAISLKKKRKKETVYGGTAAGLYMHVTGTFSIEWTVKSLTVH